jgi:type VII secretion protein EccB
MATKRDLVEAYSFSRRRLVTAFVSGAPGGREVEPTRPGRTIVGGLALAVLLVAGAAIAGIFAPRDPDAWNKPGLVVSKETGAAYVILEESDHPVLRPVINITSARLILQGDVEPTLVSQDTIDEQVIGDDIGILGAPASLPTPSLLIETGWTACTDHRTGLRLAVGEDPDVQRIPDSGFLVESEGVHYVIAQGHESHGEPAGAFRYELPEPDRPRDDVRDNLLGDLGLPIVSSAKQVSDDFLALVPPGGRLDFAGFGLTGFGDPVDFQGNDGVPDDSRVGDVVTFTASDGQDRSMLFTEEGPTVLDPFALALYRWTETPHGRLAPGTRVGDSPVETTQEVPPTAGQALPPYDGARWPDHLLQTETGEQCAELTTRPGEPPSVQIATDPGETASAAGLAAGRRAIPAVAAGRGAYVLSGDWADGSDGSPYVIDAKGKSYALVGADTAERLGYGDVPVVVVPDSWVELFDTGVNLSVDDALCPPDLDKGEKCG